MKIGEIVNYIYDLETKSRKVDELEKENKRLLNQRAIDTPVEDDLLNLEIEDITTNLSTPYEKVLKISLEMFWNKLKEGLRVYDSATTFEQWIDKTDLLPDYYLDNLALRYLSQADIKEVFYERLKCFYEEHKKKQNNQ